MPALDTLPYVANDANPQGFIRRRKIAARVGDVGWFSGYHVLSQSSAWAIVPFA